MRFPTEKNQSIKMNAFQPLQLFLHLSLKNIPQCPLTCLPPTPEQSLQLPGGDPKRLSGGSTGLLSPECPVGSRDPKASVTTRSC